MDDTCCMMLFIFSINAERHKNRSVKSQEFEIPGTIPLLISNQSWSTEKIPDWKTSPACASVVTRMNRMT